MCKLDLYDSMLTKIHPSLHFFLGRFSFPANGGCLELYRNFQRSREAFLLFSAYLSLASQWHKLESIWCHTLTLSKLPAFT